MKVHFKLIHIFFHYAFIFCAFYLRSSAWGAPEITLPPDVTLDDIENFDNWDSIPELSPEDIEAIQNENFDISSLPPEVQTTIDNKVREYVDSQLALPENETKTQAIDALTKAFVESIGIATDHHAYTPATALGTDIGLELGIEATLFTPPQSISDSISQASAALSSDGSSAGGGAIDASTQIPFIPVARVYLNKGFGQRVDVGLSTINYKESRIIGGDLKITLYQPEEGVEEGLTWAIRLGHSRTNILDRVKTQTTTPQLLVSKKLNFADPYLGVGAQFISGSVIFPMPLPAPFSSKTVDITRTANSKTLFAFMGLGIKISPTGLKLTFGGSTRRILGTPYTMTSMGVTFGFSL